MCRRARLGTLEQAGIHPLLSRLFAARGIQSPEELDDGLAKLLPPNTLKGTEAAAVLLADAIAAQKRCALWPITIATAPRPARLACAACACWVRNT